MAGKVARLSAPLYRSLFDASPGLRAAISRYVEVSLAEARLSIACNALHTVEMRLAKVLLFLADRVGSPLPIKQESLSLLLGVQRTTVGAVMAALARRDVVRSRRGKVEILDQGSLEKVACACRNTLTETARAIQSSNAPRCDP